MLPIVDANVVLRYLLNDTRQSKQAKEQIDSGCEINPEVLVEVVYVLEGVYEVPRAQIAEVLTGLLNVVYIERFDEVLHALSAYAQYSLDFVDCMLLAQNQVSGREIVTFDKALQKRLS